MKIDQIVSNYDIKSQRVMVINNEGIRVGEKPLKEAIYLAKSSGFDLIQIQNPENGIPITKFLDKNKYRYELKKKEKDFAKSQRANRIEIKELSIRPQTDENDLKRIAKHTEEFLNEEAKVKITCKFRGREIQNPDIGIKNFQKLLNMVKNGELDGKVEKTGRAIKVILKKKPVS